MYLLRHRQLTIAMLISATVSLLLFASTNATVFESDDRVRISHLHSIDDDFFAWSSSVEIDGTIEGDAFLGGNNVVTNGEITGSLNVFAFEFANTGLVGRSLRVFAFEATVSGDIDRSLVSIASTFELEADARVGRDAHITADRAIIDGHIRGSLHARGGTITLAGRVDGDVHISANSIVIEAPATITGDLTFTAVDSVRIDTVGGVVVLGDITQEVVEEEPDEEESDLSDVALSISEFLAAFLFGIIILALFDQYARATYSELQDRLGISAVAGLGAAFVTILSVLVLTIAGVLFLAGQLAFSTQNAVLGTLVMVASTVLIPITSFASISGAVLFYAGKIVMAMLVGCLMWQALKKNCNPVSKLQLFVGLAILTLLFAIPYIGTALYIIVSIIGAGGIILGIRNCHRRKSPAATTPEKSGVASPGADSTARQNPPNHPPSVSPPE